MKPAIYLKTFIKDKYVGAVAPSSKHAIKKLCSRINFNKNITIVEYGPGDGVITKCILHYMTPQSTLVAIETNGYFVKKLQECPDPRLHVIKGDAKDVISILNAQGRNDVDYIISGIPFTFFPPDTRSKIVENTKKAIKPGGKFLVYQYSTLVKPCIKRNFGNISISFVPFNIPPMFVMESIKK